MKKIKLIIFFIILITLIGCREEGPPHIITIPAIVRPNLKIDMVYQIGKLISQCARQPEQASTLTSEFDKKLFSNYKEIFPVSVEDEVIMGQTLGYVIGELIEGCTRQPEIAIELITLTEKYIGNYSMNLYTDTMIDFMTPPAVGKYIEGSGRQPIVQPLLEDILKKFIGI